MTKQSKRNQATTNQSKTRDKRPATAKRSKAQLVKRPNESATNSGAQKLNLKRLTPEYFYPDVFANDIGRVKIPTIQELEFIGDHNIAEIRAYMRHEERKLKRLIGEVQQESMKLDELVAKMPEGARCDWRGLGYAKMPEFIEDELFENGTTETYSQISEERSKKVCTCRFGRYTAEWCKRTPVPCRCGYTCLEHSSDEVEVICMVGRCSNKDQDEYISLRTIQPVKVKCKYYETCNGITPLAEHSCVLGGADRQTVEAAKGYLLLKSADFRKRLEFVEQYMHNMSEASAATGNRPSFDLSAYSALGGTKPGELIAIIAEAEGSKGYDLHFGSFIRRERTGLVVQVLNQKLTPELITITPHSPTSSKLYLKMSDFVYLMQNPKFRTVWLKNIRNWRCRLDVKTIAKALEDSERKFMEGFRRLGFFDECDAK